MTCACRTKSLGIFVQSLTELRVADTAISRPVQLCRLAASPVTFRPTPAHYQTRLFSSTSAIYTSAQEGRENIDNSSTSKAEKELSHASLYTAGDTIDKESSPPASFASSLDFEAAKQNGAILDLSDESLDTLVATLDRTSITRRVPPKVPTEFKHSNINYHAQSELRPWSKPPVMSSQLKRRKIIKETAKPQLDAEDTYAPRRENWQIQKQALKEKFPEGWQPRKRLSPDALEGIRALHTQFPEQYTTQVLAKHFEVSPEAMRRIIRTKWTPSPEEETDRQERWFNRGKNIWSHMAALGKKPPRRWRREGVVREPHWNQKKGPRTEYPYMPRRERVEERAPVESAQRKLSGSLL
ncbi:hypothetical protein EV127DRAFT_405089 [Xylaria flabelliformis]|nr:hypothetical protein EV127DRAFT_405089 [Xylaria flabelliformis]